MSTTIPSPLPKKPKSPIQQYNTPVAKNNVWITNEQKVAINRLYGSLSQVLQYLGEHAIEQLKG